MLDQQVILERLRLSGHGRIFALGLGERVVTVYRQQLRGYLLARALPEAWRRIAVVGAGAGGLSSAVTAAMDGREVILFEREDRVLKLFADTYVRNLDPRMYDWPDPGCRNGVAGLPVLDWTTAQARDVAKVLRDQYDAIRSVFPIDERFGTIVSDVAEEPESATVTVGSGTPEKFDAVVIAVGFGLERHLDSTRSHSYWADTSLHNPVQPGSAPRRIVVSGLGDGGAIDFLRAALGGFDQASHLQDLLPAGDAEVVRIEETVRSLKDASMPEWFQAVCALECPDLDGRLDERLARGGITDARKQLVLLGKDAVVPCADNARPLNRSLLVRTLLRMGMEVDAAGTVTKGGPFHGLALDASAVEDGGPFAGFDVVTRHGPDLRTFAGLPTVFAAAFTREPDGARVTQKSHVDPLGCAPWDPAEASRRAEIVYQLCRSRHGTEPDSDSSAKPQSWSPPGILDVLGVLLRFCSKHQAALGAERRDAALGAAFDRAQQLPRRIVGIDLFTRGDLRALIEHLLTACGTDGSGILAAAFGLVLALEEAAGRDRLAASVAPELTPKPRDAVPVFHGIELVGWTDSGRWVRLLPTQDVNVRVRYRWLGGALEVPPVVLPVSHVAPVSSASTFCWGEHRNEGCAVHVRIGQSTYMCAGDCLSCARDKERGIEVFLGLAGSIVPLACGSLQDDTYTELTALLRPSHVGVPRCATAHRHRCPQTLGPAPVVASPIPPEACDV